MDDLSIVPIQPLNLAIASFDVSANFSNEASLYGTPAGLSWLAGLFSEVASGKSDKHQVRVKTIGPLLDVGTSINITLERDWTHVAQIAQVKTMRLLEHRRNFHGSKELDATATIEQCKCRHDGAFAAAYPDYSPAPTLEFMGNSLGLQHIADGLKWMSEVEYEPFNPRSPEKSEHYHSWIDKDEDGMLGCGLGLLYGRMDHRKDGDTTWIIDCFRNFSSEMKDFVSFVTAQDSDPSVE